MNPPEAAWRRSCLRSRPLGGGSDAHLAISLISQMAINPLSGPGISPSKHLSTPHLLTAWLGAGLRGRGREESGEGGSESRKPSGNTGERYRMGGEKSGVCKKRV